MAKQTPAQPAAKPAPQQPQQTPQLMIEVGTPVFVNGTFSVTVSAYASTGKGNQRSPLSGESVTITVLETGGTANKQTGGDGKTRHTFANLAPGMTYTFQAQAAGGVPASEQRTTPRLRLEFTKDFVRPNGVMWEAACTAKVFAGNQPADGVMIKFERNGADAGGTTMDSEYVQFTADDFGEGTHTVRALVPGTPLSQIVTFTCRHSYTVEMIVDEPRPIAGTTPQQFETAATVTVKDHGSVIGGVGVEVFVNTVSQGVFPTNAQGVVVWDFNNLAPGPYTFVARVPVAGVSDRKVVTIAAPQMPAIAKLLVSRSQSGTAQYSFVVKVEDGDGKGIRGVSVGVDDSANSAKTTITTDASGTATYACNVPNPGEHRVSFSAGSLVETRSVFGPF